MTGCNEREGVIVSVEPGKLLVRLDPEDAGESEGCKCCAMRGMCRGRTSRGMDVKVPVTEADPRRPGERVRLSYHAANPALAAAIMFVPALVGLLFGGFVANWLLGEGDFVFLAGAGGGLVLGVLLTLIASRSIASLGPEVALADAAPESGTGPGVEV